MGSAGAGLALEVQSQCKIDIYFLRCSVARCW